MERIMVETWGDSVGHLAWGWDLWWRGGGWRMAAPPNSPQHLIWADATRQMSRRPETTFAVVRDPVARLSSEYRYQRRHRRGTRSGRALARLPFPFWVRLMLAVAHRHPYAFDNHLRPQCDFVPEDATVFRLEEGLQAVADWLSAQTGETLCPPARALVTGQAAPIDPATRARIEAAFSQDFERFGYPRQTLQSPPRDLADWLASALAPAIVWLDRHGRL